MTTSICPHLPWSTLCPVQRRTFLGFTVEWVVVVAAPELLAGVDGGVLRREVREQVTCEATAERLNSLKHHVRNKDAEQRRSLDIGQNGSLQYIFI